MKMIDYLKKVGKKEIYSHYYKIMEDTKEYEKISGKKMIEEIIKFYSDYNNILEICTEKELKFLEKVLRNDKDLQDYKYFFECFELFKKLLLYENEETLEITMFEEIEDSVKKALAKVNWKKVKKSDEINSVLLGYLKVNGNASVQSLCAIGAVLLDMSEDDVYDWIYDNKLINFYTVFTDEYFSGVDDYFTIVNYVEYLSIIDELNEERSKQAGAGVGILDAKEYSEIFYTGFSTKKPIIKTLVKKMHSLGNISEIIAHEMQISALLNGDRQHIFDILDLLINKGFKKVEELVNLIDPALDEMPSGALNGLTPIENEEKKQTVLSTNYEYKQKSVKQGNAKLSNEDTDLFYKLYFGLLEFVNRKYNIVPKLKIYEAKKIDPNKLIIVIEKLWENPSSLIDEFIKTNPFKFSKEELDIVSNFKKGKNEMFFIVKYEKEYAAFLSMSAMYMVKGLTSNIDEVIPLSLLPTLVFTRLLPFKDYIIYDSILNEATIHIGSSMKNTILKDAEKSKKIYKLK